jgi:transcriptional regulator with GAF, ATPase, and Fis domain
MADENTTNLRRGSEGGTLSLIVSSAAGVVNVPLDLAKEYVIGRAPGTGITVDDPSVSRQHAVLRTTDFTLEDLGSTNGSRVSGNALTPNSRVRVAVGVVIELGAATLLLQRLPSSALSALLATQGDPVRPRPAASDDDPVVYAPNMVRVYQTLATIAPSNMTVVVLGESGVGKEILVQELHRRSLRADKPFLRLNCASFAESVLEGELFGYERGAFTSALQARPGLFESADGGTVFLDEIGEMPLGMQAKLLRVLENGEVLRIGGRQTKKVNVRFVAATHRDLRFLIAGGAFRQDLYFRLNGFTVVVPPLRERKEDILPLAERFLALSAGKLQRKPPTLGVAARHILLRYNWPGNVRELRTFIERVLAFARGGEITEDDLVTAAPELLHSSTPTGRSPDATGRVPPVFLEEPRTGSSAVTVPPPPGDSGRLSLDSREMRDAIEQVGLPRVPAELAVTGTFPQAARGHLSTEIRELERQRIVEALESCGGNQSRAAKMLGMPRRSLLRRIEEFGLVRPRKGPT